MIELSWFKIRDPELNAALHSLARARVPYRTTVKILALVKALEAEQKKADAVAKVLQEKYFKLDPETKTFALKEDSLKDEAEKAEKEFAETKGKFKIPKIKPEELENVELTASQLSRIEPFIDTIEGDGDRHLHPVEGNA